MYVWGTKIEHNVQIEIEPINLVERLFDYFKYETCYFIEDDKIYCYIPYGRDKLTCVKKLISDDKNKVKELQTLLDLKNMVHLKETNENC